MPAITLLSGNKTPADADIDLGMEGNIRRCGTYVRIREAVHETSKART